MWRAPPSLLSVVELKETGGDGGEPGQVLAIAKVGVRVPKGWSLSGHNRGSREGPLGDRCMWRGRGQPLAEEEERGNTP